MFFLYEVFSVLILVLFFLSYSRLKIHDKIKNLENENVIINNLIDTVDDGFYVWDSKKRIEKFSPNLLISLNTVFYSFNEFVNFFEQSEGLIKNFTEAKKINKSFTIDLKAKESEIYCICHGKSIIDYSNNVIGVLLWIKNISNYKTKSNELKLENKKLIKEIENYKDLFNSLSYPILKYNKYQKVKFYNLFYHKHINYSQRLAITKSVYNEKSEKHIITYENERKIFNFTKVSIQGSDEIVVYGQDISNEEKLRTKLNDYLATYKILLKDLSAAIVIYNKSQKITFYNNTFIRIFQLDQKFLKSHPTYYEIMFHLFESKKLLKKEDFQVINEKRYTLFKEPFESYNNILHLTNGKLLKVLIINYASEGLLFSYTEYKKS